MIRIVVVDDHSPTRLATISQLQSGDLIEVVGEAETSDQALKLSEKLLPDIVLLDLHLPGLFSSLDLIKRLTALRNVKVIAFASQVVGAEVSDLLDAGASAYILKGDPSALIRMTILMVSRGSRNITSSAVPREISKLTAPERVLLREITKKGKVQKAAERLGVSEPSLLETVHQLSQKLEIDDAEKLIKWAKKQGF
jgi:DNA-binding NarL/FixJ family response regulator